MPKPKCHECGDITECVEYITRYQPEDAKTICPRCLLKVRGIFDDYLVEQAMNILLEEKGA